MKTLCSVCNFDLSDIADLRHSKILPKALCETCYWKEHYDLEGKLKIFVLHPGEAGKVDYVSNNETHLLGNLQKIVGGYLEMLRLPNRPELTCVMNEEALYHPDKNKPNFAWRQSADIKKAVLFGNEENYIQGSVFFARMRGSDLASLLDDDVEYIERFTSRRA